MSTRARELLASLALVALSLLFCIGVLEVALRIAGYDPLGSHGDERGLVLRASEDPRLRFDLRPNAEGQAFGTAVRVNAAGFRDSDYPLDKGERYRIVVIGDSITFGLRLPAEESFPEQLEALLRNADPAVDVLNLGIAGYDILQEVAFLEDRGLAYAPDLVVVGYCMNDAGTFSPQLGFVESLERMRSPLYRLRSALFLRGLIDRTTAIAAILLAGDREGNFQRQYADAILPVDGDPALVEMIENLRAATDSGSYLTSFGFGVHSELPLTLYTSEARVGRLGYGFRRLAQLSEERGFDTLVLVIPHLVDDDRYDLAYEIVAHQARKYGLDVLTVRDELEKAGFERLRVRSNDATHPNAEGHRIIAERLRDHLRETGRL